MMEMRPLDQVAYYRSHKRPVEAKASADHHKRAQLLGLVLPNVCSERMAEALISAKTMPTDKQILLASKLGLQLPERCCKREAARLIDRTIREQAKVRAKTASEITDEEAGLNF